MSDRIVGLTVTFRKPIKDEDAEDLIKLIACVTGVGAITTSIVASPEFYIAKEQARMEYRQKVFDLFVNYPDKKDSRDE